MILNFAIQIEVDDEYGEHWADYHKYQFQQHFRRIEKSYTGKLKGLVFIPMPDKKIFDEQEYREWEEGRIDL